MPSPLPLIGLSVLPSVGLAIAVAVVLAWLVWILADPQASDALDLLLLDIGLQAKPIFPGDWIKELHGWSKAGSRIALSVLLCIVEVGSLVMVAINSLSPGTSHSLLAIGGLILVTAGWLAVLYFRERLSFVGFLLRLWCQRRLLRQLADELRTKWPERDGQLPIVGRHKCDASCPDMLTLVMDDQSQFGPLVRRRTDGSFCFDLMIFPEWKLELFRNGVRPASFDDVFEKFAIHNHLKTTVQLDRITFVSKYDSSFQVTTPDEAAYLSNMLKQMAAKMGLGK